MHSPLDTFEALRWELFLYYETPFRVADQSVMRKRRQLLDAEGVTWREPWLEPVPEYEVTGLGREEALGIAGASAETAEFASQGLLTTYPDIFVHQQEALAAACSGRNVVLTAGTGSGKTEAFLIPLIDALVKESASWSGTSPVGSSWWRKRYQHWSPQRSQESGRLPGVRGLIIYPMNALVEDQLVRLRRTLDSQDARRWLDRHRGGHRFYFGRYTGQTPVSGHPGDRPAERRLRRVLHDLHERAERVRDDPKRRYFLPQLDGTEMRSRWDMQEHPPDLLITNHSMLNIALLRRIEEGLFDRTREWLEASEEHVFHIVVDELHMHRGTAGTEVAYLLRKLLHRLGLHPESPQVRFLATSASLGGGTTGKRFLSEFFGAPPNSFEVIEGAIRQPGGEHRDLDGFAGSFANLLDGDRADPEATARLLRDSGSADVLARVCTPVGAKTPRARAAATLDRALFPNEARGGADYYSRSFRGFLRAIAAAGSGDSLPRIRAHLFFRNVLGVWACTRASCPESGNEGMTVGKLFRGRVHRCTCGGRVLELLYCQVCGELFLGGYLAPEREPGDQLTDAHLLTEISELDSVPDQARTGRSSLNYAVYWPNDAASASLPNNWTRHNGTYEFGFRPAVYDPETGGLRVRAVGQTGWVFTVNARGAAARPEAVPPFPTKCPRCHADWEWHGQGRVENPDRTRSPIRTMQTGYEKLVQVLTDRLLRSLSEDGSEPKLVLFSDSRQDAAKLSAGLEKRHYQDLVRQALVNQLASKDPARDVDLFKKFLDGDRSDEAVVARERLRTQQRAIFDALSDAHEGLPYATEQADSLLAQLVAGVRVAPLIKGVEQALIALGVNPAGPDRDVQRQWVEGTQYPWTELYDWESRGSQARSSSDLSVPLQRLRERLDHRVQRECLVNIFSGNGRDFESLGLAYPAAHLRADHAEAKTLPDHLARELASATLRILGDSRRIETVRSGQQDPPAAVRRYWDAVDRKHGFEGGTAQRVTMAAIGHAVREWLIAVEELRLSSATGAAWECKRCRRTHLHPAAGICTSCAAELPDEPTGIVDPTADDYYSYLATAAGPPSRLHCEELSGQTDTFESPKRQARFQHIFLEDEIELVDEIDLLSVTTTMEAGVDIGGLRGVCMANVPPQRFNYQQRVGRAGRRGDSVSYALTVCRDRTHDEHYFNDPDRITGDPPPRPYLDLRRPEIIRRVLSAEMLRYAFRKLADRNPGTELGSSVHGEFGLIDDWPDHRQAVIQILYDGATYAREVVAALLAGAPEVEGPDADELEAFVTGTRRPSLASGVDQLIKIPATQDELSQHLAEHGLLPMFGFPTRVRTMYLRRPRRSYPWPPPAVIDRNLDLAIVEFAPGSQVVKDKELHTAVGLTAYLPAGPEPTQVEDPLDAQLRITLCRNCLSVNHDNEEQAGRLTCDVCGSGAPEYGSLQLAEPAGFRTDHHPQDFEGTFTYVARATTPRIVPDVRSMTSTGVDYIRATAGRGDVFIVNDRNGHRFRFAQAQNAEDKTWWAVHLWADPTERRQRYMPDALDTSHAWEGALGFTKTTDALLLRAQAIPEGIDVAPFEAGRRAAWYSLGFLLRAAAAEHLSIDPAELDVGYVVRQQGDQRLVECFLADSLENGAGYSTHLGSQPELEGFISEASSLVARLNEPGHAEQCESSCPDCLREFWNIIFHPLLDWRLSRDMLQLFREGEFELSAWEHTEHTAAEAFAKAFGGNVRTFGRVSAVESTTADRLLLVRHPLESGGVSNQQPLTPRQDEAIVQAEGEVNDPRAIRHVSGFDLERRPGWIASQLSWTG